MMDNKHLQAIVQGRVQGVCFRAFVQQKALELSLNGFVRNLPSGNAVEVQAEGDGKALERLVEYLKSGPEGAAVSSVITTWSRYTSEYQQFKIRY